MVLMAEDDNVEIGKSNEEVLDARVLSITMMDGRRMRSFRENIPELTETSWSDQGWPFGNIAYEDSFLYLGSGKTRGLLAVSPQLEEYVASELSKETATLKERRKARGERPGGPQSKKEPKGGGKGQP